MCDTHTVKCKYKYVCIQQMVEVDRITCELQWVMTDRISLTYFGVAYICMVPDTRSLNQLKGFCSLWLMTPFEGSE